jgi:hypothetical protein
VSDRVWVVDDEWTGGCLRMKLGGDDHGGDMHELKLQRAGGRVSVLRYEGMAFRGDSWGLHSLSLPGSFRSRRLKGPPRRGSCGRCERTTMGPSAITKRLRHRAMCC